MCPKVTEHYTNEKINQILTASTRVFVRKGFSETTMQDLVEECAISRGGLYRYFSSTEEVFIAVLESESQVNENAFQGLMDKNMDAFAILTMFMEAQVESIANIRQSLIPAAYEFFIRNIRDGQTARLLERRHDIALKALVGLMEYGISKGQFPKETDADAISNCIITFIEGLNMTAIATVIDVEPIRKQMNAFMRMLERSLKN